MSYVNTTTGRLALPHPVAGAALSGKGETRAAQIVDNAVSMLAKLAGRAGALVLSEGAYTGDFATGDSSVTLAVGGTGFSVEALINGVAIAPETPVVWSTLADSQTHYLYLQLVESGLYGEAQLSSRQDRVCVPVANTSGTTPTNAVLVAVATTTGAAISVVSNAQAADNDLFASGKPLWIPEPLGSVTVPEGEYAVTESFTGLSDDAHVTASKTSPGPAMDYIECVTDEFTLHLTGPAPAGGVTFNYKVERL